MKVLMLNGSPKAKGNTAIAFKQKPIVIKHTKIKRLIKNVKFSFRYTQG